MSILKYKKSDGTFSDVPVINGKSAYQYAVDGGYTGTEEEFTANMANYTYKTTQTVTLSSSSWSSSLQTVSVTGVTASNTVIVAPSDRTSAEAWGSSKVMCTAQGSGTLTFTCDSVPTSNISVSVVILG